MKDFTNELNGCWDSIAPRFEVFNDEDVVLDIVMAVDTTELYLASSSGVLRHATVGTADLMCAIYDLVHEGQVGLLFTQCMDDLSKLTQ